MNEAIERIFVLNENDDLLNDPDLITYADYDGAMDYIQFQDDAGVVVTFAADDIERIIDILHEIQQIRQPARRKPKPYAYYKRF